MKGWQPIETIPAEGVFLVYLAEPMHGSRVHAARWRPNMKTIGNVFHFDAPKVTHWREQLGGPDDPDEPSQIIALAKDAREWGPALNDAAWTFIDTCPEKSALLFNSAKTSLRAAIVRYLAVLEAQK